jgi:hypothetical protein
MAGGDARDDPVSGAVENRRDDPAGRAVKVRRGPSAARRVADDQQQAVRQQEFTRQSIPETRSRSTWRRETRAGFMDAS